MGQVSQKVLVAIQDANNWLMSWLALVILTINDETIPLDWKEVEHDVRQTLSIFFGKRPSTSHTRRSLYNDANIVADLRMRSPGPRP